MIGQLNEIQINNLLTSQVVGRLACTDGFQPYIVPVTYAYDGKNIFGQSNEGTKLEILRKNNRVCFEVDLMLNMTNWQSVIVFGEFEELSEEDAEKAREVFFNRMYPLMTSNTVHHYGNEPYGDMDESTQVKHVMYRINVIRVSGRFEKK